MSPRRAEPDDTERPSIDDYSKETRQWIAIIREDIKDRISTYDVLPEAERRRYPSLRDWFVWPPGEQEKWGHAGPIESDVDVAWDEAAPKTRKELGGSKSEAAKVVAIVLRDEFGVDIVDEVLRHAEPCYAVHDQVVALDWDTEEATRYRKAAKLVRHKDLDRGSALQLYWAFAPEYYTQFSDPSEIKQSERKRAFELLKEVEARLLADDFKTSLIAFKPVPEESTTDRARWRIPDELVRPNLGEA